MAQPPPVPPDDDLFGALPPELAGIGGDGGDMLPADGMEALDEMLGAGDTPAVQAAAAAQAAADYAGQLQMGAQERGVGTQTPALQAAAAAAAAAEEVWMGAQARQVGVVRQAETAMMIPAREAAARAAEISTSGRGRGRARGRGRGRGGGGSRGQGRGGGGSGSGDGPGTVGGVWGGAVGGPVNGAGFGAGDGIGGMSDLVQYHTTQKTMLTKAQGEERQKLLATLASLTTRVQAARDGGDAALATRLQDAQSDQLTAIQELQAAHRAQATQMENIMSQQLAARADAAQAQVVQAEAQHANVQRFMAARDQQLARLKAQGDRLQAQEAQRALAPASQVTPHEVYARAQAVQSEQQITSARAGAAGVGEVAQVAAGGQALGTMSPSAPGVALIGGLATAGMGERRQSAPAATGTRGVGLSGMTTQTPRRLSTGATIASTGSIVGGGGAGGSSALAVVEQTAAVRVLPQTSPAAAPGVRLEPALVAGSAPVRLPEAHELPVLPESVCPPFASQYAIGVSMIAYAWFDRGTPGAEAAFKMFAVALAASLRAQQESDANTVIGQEARRAYAVAAVGYGRAAAAVGKPDVGMMWLRRGLLVREFGPRFRDACVIDFALFKVQYSADIAEAESLFRKVLSKVDNTSDSYTDLRADALFGVATCLIIAARKRNDPTDRTIWDSAQKILTQVMQYRFSKGYQAGYASAVSAMSVVLTERKDGDREAHADNALKVLRSVEKIVMELGRDAFAQWACNMGLAWRAKASYASTPDPIAHKKQCAELAVHFFSVSLECFKAIGMSSSKESAFVRLRLATALLRVPRSLDGQSDAVRRAALKKDMETAVELLKEALGLLKTVGSPPTAGYATVVYRLGCVHQTRLAGVWEQNQEFALRCFSEAKKLEKGVLNVRRRARLALRMSTILLLRKKGNRRKNVDEAIKVLQDVMRDLVQNPSCPEFAHVAQQISIAFIDRLALGRRKADSDDARCALGATLAALKVLNSSQSTSSTSWLSLRAGEAYMETTHGDRLKNLKSACALFAKLNDSFGDSPAPNGSHFQVRVQLSLSLVCIELAAISTAKSRHEVFLRVLLFLRNVIDLAGGMNDMGRYGIAASSLLHILMCIGRHDEAESQARYVARTLARARQTESADGAAFAASGSSVGQDNIEVFDAVVFSLAGKEGPLWNLLLWIEEHKLQFKPLSLVPRNSPVSRLSRAEQTRYMHAAGRSRYITIRSREEGKGAEERSRLKECVRASETILKKLESDAASLPADSASDQGVDSAPRTLRDIESGFDDDGDAVRALQKKMSVVQSDVVFISLFSCSLWRDPASLTMVPGVRAVAVFGGKIVSHSSDDVVDPVFDIQPPLFQCTRKCSSGPGVDVSGSPSFKFRHEISPAVTKREAEYCTALASFLTQLVRKFVDVPLNGKRFTFSSHRGLSRVCLSSLIPSVDAADGLFSFSFDGTTMEPSVEVVEHVVDFLDLDLKRSKVGSTSVLSSGGAAQANDIGWNFGPRRAVSPVSAERSSSGNNLKPGSSVVGTVASSGAELASGAAGPTGSGATDAEAKITVSSGNGGVSDAMAVDTAKGVDQSVAVVRNCDVKASTEPGLATVASDPEACGGDLSQGQAADRRDVDAAKNDTPCAPVSSVSSPDKGMGAGDAVRLTAERENSSGRATASSAGEGKRKRPEPTSGFGDILGIVKKSKLYEDFQKS